MDTLARQLWALGDPVRLRLLTFLPLDPGSGPAYNVSQLAEKLGLSQPTLSHHLRVLRQAGIVSYEKQCRDCHYCIDRAALDAVMAGLQEALIRRKEG